MLDPFYPIADSADWVARLLLCGVRLVQLRIKDRPAADVRGEIAKAQALCMKAGAQLIVNDYWVQAIDLGCDFVHLGQGDLGNADLAAIRRAGIKLGLSTHEEAELARALETAPDYVALGPIFPTTLKSMRFAPQGIAKITEWKKRVGAIPLVAIGGIKLEHAAEIFAAGADSIAVVSDVTQNADPDARVRAWLAVQKEMA